MMTETTRKKRTGNGAGTQAPQPDPAADKASKAPERGQRDAPLGGRLDQVGTLLAKGLDLAEAGVSLGVTILNRVGAAAQHQLAERADGAVPSPEAGQAQASPQPAWPAEPSGAPPPQAPEEPAYGITNRLPLLPGGPVQISFSINNDSMIEPKKVQVRVEGFTGDTHGAQISSALFKVKPAQKTIAPVDFDKFYLTGTLPADVPPDVYRGCVVVTSDTELGIPVILAATQL